MRVWRLRAILQNSIMSDDIAELRSRLAIELESVVTAGFPVMDGEEDNDAITVITEALYIARCEDTGDERVCFFEDLCRKIDVTGKLVQRYSAGFGRPLSKLFLSESGFVLIGLLLLREILDTDDLKLLNTAFKLRELNCIPDDIQWPDVFVEGLDTALQRVLLP